MTITLDQVSTDRVPGLQALPLRIRERFVIDENGCWIFTGYRLRGYGRVMYKAKNYLTHRLTYLLLVGPIPEGHQVDHLCRVPACANPDHLEAVTPHENNRRSNSETARNARKTHCKRGHEFVIYGRTYTTSVGGPGRDCLECRRIRRRDYTERRSF